MPFSLRRRFMFVVLSLVYQLVFLHGVVMTTVANDIMRDMDLTPVRMGWLGSAYLYAYAAVMLVSGVVAAWLGPRKTLTVLYAISGAGGLLFAWSSSFETAALGRAMSGFGMAASMTSAFTLFGRWYAPSAYSRVCAVYFAIGGLGTLIGIGPLSYLSAAWGWRTVFALIALLTLAYAAAIFLAVRDWPPDDVPELAGAGGVRRGDMGLASMWQGVKEVSRNRDFWRMIVWFTSLPGMYFAFCGLWAVPYLERVYRMPHGDAGVITSLVAFGFIIGTPTVSAISDKYLRSYRVPVGAAGALTMLVSAYMIWRIDTMAYAELIVLMLAIGLALNSPNACIYAAARCLFGTRMTGITGGVFGCAAFLGGAAMQIISGWLLDLGELHKWGAAQSYAAAFTPFILCGAVALVAGFTISKDSFR